MKRVILILSLAVILTGCATTQDLSSVDHLKLRVGELERQADMKDDSLRDLNQEIRNLSYKVNLLETQLRERKTLSLGPGSVAEEDAASEEGIIRVSASTQEVQQALQEAGFYEGSVDGKIGALTQKAIADFQKARGLKVDGIVGAKTWAELQSYSN